MNRMQQKEQNAAKNCTWARLKKVVQIIFCLQNMILEPYATMEAVNCHSVKKPKVTCHKGTAGVS